MIAARVRARLRGGCNNQTTQPDGWICVPGISPQHMPATRSRFGQMLNGPVTAVAASPGPMQDRRWPG